MGFRAAIAQVDSRVGDLPYNVDHHLAFVDRAIREKARLIVFPELSLSGYTLRDLAADVALDPVTSRVLMPLRTKSRKITIVAGFVESGKDHGLYNAAVCFEDGEVRQVHRKIYPPTYGMFEEGRYFSRGASVRAFDSKLGRLGMLVCEDMWHLPLPYLLVRDGAEMILGLTASPTRMGGEKDDLSNARINHEHQATYARLLSSYVLFSNRVGFEDGVSFWGGSVAYDPFGHQLARGKYFDEDLLIAEILPEEVRRARRLSRHVLDDDPQLVLDALRRLKNRPNF
jgi:predicted amidohydrolase